MINNKITTREEVSKNLGTSRGNLSKILNGQTEPNNSLIILANLIYGNKRKPHPDPTIENIIKIMEEMNKSTKESVFNSVQEKKQLQDLMREKKDKEAA